jgi:uncharacterized protein YndB with AHSA1/START domain
MPERSSPPVVFTTQRVFPHPPAAVYAAFADADVLARWWGPKGFTNTFEMFEFEPDGRWEFVMHGPDGGRYLNSSVFRTVDAPRMVVIEHISPPHFVLSVTLEPDASGTRLTWAQGFPDPDVAARLEKLVVPANEENLDRLAAVLDEVRHA